MNMEQINMMAQMVMQQGQLSGASSGKDSDSSFQDMMNQKQDVASRRPIPAQARYLMRCVSYWRR